MGGSEKPSRGKVKGGIWLTHLTQVFEGALGRACTGAGKGAGRHVVGRGLGRVDAEVYHTHTPPEAHPEQQTEASVERPEQHELLHDTTVFVRCIGSA